MKIKALFKQFIRKLATIIGFVIILHSFVYADSKSSDMTNQSIGRMPSNIKVENPAAYYKSRIEAISLVRNELWDKAIPLLEKLTSQYQDDGDTWYLLGLSYFQREDWSKSIHCMQKALELGVFISNIPSGSPPSNDIMIKVAKAYSKLNKNVDAISWINKSLEARYDDRMWLAGDKDFDNINNIPEFIVATGEYLQSNLSRNDAWRADLEFLVSEVTRLHVDMFHEVSPVIFQDKVRTISNKIPTLTDKQIIFQFMELVGMLGNGHNFIIPANANRGNFSQLPMQFYWFSNGLYIVQAEDEYKQFIGYEVTHIGNTSIDVAFERIKTVNARDNEMQQLWLSPYYLSLPSVLEGLDIIENSDAVSITLTNSDGKRYTISPTASPLSFRGFPMLPALEGSEELHNLKMNDNYWYNYSENNSSIYVQFNYVQQEEAQSLEDFNIELRKKTIDLGVENLILDIRHNAGGNGTILPPMLKTLIQFETMNEDGKIFVIIGRNTFSAAHTLLAWINQFTNAVLVGEPSGSRPNALSEAGWFKLPYSGITGIISTQFHQSSRAEDHRIWVAPHVPVSLSSSDYFSGKDPALDAIYEIIEANN